jgi:hypothetical protein
MEAISVSDFSPWGKRESRYGIYCYLGSTSGGKSQGSALCFDTIDREEITSDASGEGRC